MYACILYILYTVVKCISQRSPEKEKICFVLILFLWRTLIHLTYLNAMKKQKANQTCASFQCNTLLFLPLYCILKFRMYKRSPGYVGVVQKSLL